MKIGAYWATCNNVGDKLTQVILNYQKGVSVQRVAKEYAKFVGVGSILERFQGAPSNNYKYPLYVFGTGYDVYQAKEDGFIRQLKVYALRGTYTKTFVEKMIGKNLDSVVLGDIGLLAGCLLPKVLPKKRYDLGIVPHYVDAKDKRFKELALRIPNAKILNVKHSPEQFARQLLQCKCVISTAMHPLIMCDAFRIPNMWAYLPEANQVDMSHKFFDYYSVFGMHKKPYILDETGLMGDIPAIIENEYDITDEMVNKKVAELQSALDRMLKDMENDRIKDIINSICAKGKRCCEILPLSKEKNKGIANPKKNISKESYASIGRNVTIVDSSNIHDKQNVSIANNVYIGREASIWGVGGIEIGENTILGPRVTIHSSNHRYEGAELLPYDNTSYLQKVKIGRNVWIGDSAMLCPGCEIGDGAVVAMGAVVSGKVPKCAVVAGNPAKVIKMRDEERYERLDREGQYYLKEKRRAHLKPKYVEKNVKKG